MPVMVLYACHLCQTCKKCHVCQYASLGGSYFSSIVFERVSGVYLTIYLYKTLLVQHTCYVWHLLTCGFKRVDAKISIAMGGGYLETIA